MRQYQVHWFGCGLSSMASGDGVCTAQLKRWQQSDEAISDSKFTWLIQEHDSNATCLKIGSTHKRIAVIFSMAGCSNSSSSMRFLLVCVLPWVSLKIRTPLSLHCRPCCHMNCCTRSFHSFWVLVRNFLANKIWNKQEFPWAHHCQYGYFYGSCLCKSIQVNK